MELNNPASGIISKAICARIDSDNTIQLEITAGNYIILLFNKEMIELSEDFEVLNLEGVIIHFGVNSFTMQFWNGIRIEIGLAESNDSFFVVAIVPDRLAGKTFGLIGKRNEPMPSDKRDLPKQFVDGWRVNSLNDLFVYHHESDRFKFANPNHNSFSSSENIGDCLNKIHTDECGVNVNCRMDICISRNIHIGRMNVQFENVVNGMKNEFKRIGKLCIQINPLRFPHGTIQMNFTSQNSIFYSFRCEPGFLLEGRETVLCQDGKFDENLPKCNLIVKEPDNTKQSKNASPFNNHRSLSLFCLINAISFWVAFCI